MPIDQALVTEYAPARIRGRVAAMLPLCWPMGYFTAAGMALLLVPHVGWRWLFAIGVLPALLAFVIRRRVPELPRWLASQGRHEEARESLAYVGVDRRVAGTGAAGPCDIAATAGGARCDVPRSVHARLTRDG